MTRKQQRLEQWHHQPVERALQAFDSNEKGLATTDADKRRQQWGDNNLPEARKTGPLLRFLRQLHNILIYILLIAASVTALLGHWLDSAVIMGVVVINALIGFIQEGKAQKALDAIRHLLSAEAQVLRDEKKTTVPASQLVPGDIVFLTSGDKVPADLRLLEVRSLRIEEASLTGESEPVEKTTDPVEETAPLGDRSSMAWSSTLVTYGQATGVVTAIGEQTEIGRINAMLADVHTLETPLLRKMAIFGRWLSLGIICLSALTFLFGILVRDYSLAEMFLAAVGLAVAAIPEGLPAIMTITLALGVQQMARRNAIIRRLPVVEALGSVTVICSDKTGTLTRNEMTVQRLITAGGMLEVTGAGYAPLGEILKDGQPVQPDSEQLREIARCSLLCNDARLSQTNGEWVLAGDPTEGALLTLAMKAGLDADKAAHEWPRQDVVPFESEHRFMATLNRTESGQRIYLKGAPEKILPLCTHVLNQQNETLNHDYWQKQMDNIAAQGMRLLAIAFRDAKENEQSINFDRIEAGDFTLLAITGLSDPPREEAARAVAACRSAGIRVTMITGDHGTTAKAIGRQLGLADDEIQALVGQDIENMDDEQLKKVVAETQVFARASPEHKLRLVTALQANGDIVAMTGDGVNDAPALKRADVGVAMGHKGTEVSREASEVVLADDNFASIVAAVEEGRIIYDNLRKAIIYILPTSVGQAGLVMIAILLGMALPVTPVQILWVNMITAVTLSLALAFEKAESGVMSRPPRPPSEPLLNSFMLWRIGFVSLLLVLGSLALFLWQYQIRGESLELARTTAVNALMFGEAFYLFSCRYLMASSLNVEAIFGSRPVLVALTLMLALQLLFTYLPVMQYLFETRNLDLESWGYIILFGLAVLLIVEAEKFLLRHQRDNSL